jgi:hypothetical protein
MARKRGKMHCRFCGDSATTDPDTWEPTGLCTAHAEPANKAIRKARRAVRRSEREEVVVDQKPLQPNGPYRTIKTYRGEVVVNDAGEPV